MNGRCNNPNNPRYKYYGGRGIKVCARWSGKNGFVHFMEDMYEFYLKHIAEFGEKNTSLDRWPDVNGNYELSNCKWSTNTEQIRHRRDSVISENYEEHIFWKNKLSIALNNILYKKMKKSMLIENIVGCSLEDFRRHIESQFKDGMTWENRGKGLGKWQLDHIKGCNNFDLSKEENRKKCFNYINYQPMWEEDHLKKSKLRTSPTDLTSLNIKK
jgi:hypothetical protein